MVDREKVIANVTGIVSDMQEEVDEWKDYSDSELSHGLTCDCDWWYKTLQTLKDALALLKEQEPRVMTWQEVIGAAIECKPLYVEVKDSEDKEPGDDRWAMVTQYKDSITNGMIRAMSSYITSEILFKDWYGKIWRCWTSRPDEKRRVETPWERMT